MSNQNNHEIQSLLAELDHRQHAGAADLRRAWAIDALLTNQLSVAEAAAAAGVSEVEFRGWLRQRNLSQATTAISIKEPPVAQPEISVVIPVFNEQENIDELHSRLVKVLGSDKNYELLFVDDGSDDLSAGVVRRIQRNDSAVKLLSLSRNFGQQAAIAAGLDYSRGRAVIILDSDLQDPPEVISEMINRWRDGARVVCAVRRGRKENLIKRGAYHAFYRTYRALSVVEIHLDSGDFCLLDRTVVDHLKSLPERNRFLRGLRSWVGFEQVVVLYERGPRNAGKTKYSWGRLIRLALDGIFSLSSFPLRVASYAGVLTCLGGLGYLAFAVVSHFINQRVPVGWTSTVALILLLGGMQLILLGVLGEYVARVYDETKQRPLYIVESFSDGQKES